MIHNWTVCLYLHQGFVLTLSHWCWIYSFTVDEELIGTLKWVWKQDVIIAIKDTELGSMNIETYELEKNPKICFCIPFSFESIVVQCQTPEPNVRNFGLVVECWTDG